MGCSASRPETLISSSSARKALNPLPRTISHLVHHPPLKKGDTHHLVSLTSSTYGSLLLIDHPKDPSSSSSSSSPKDCQSPDSVINTWELMADLGDEEIQQVLAIPIASKSDKTLVFDDNQCLSVKKQPQFDEIQRGLVRERVKNLGSSFRSFKSSSLSDFEQDPVQDFSNTNPSQFDDFRFESVHEKVKHLGDSFFDSRKTNVFYDYEEVQTHDSAKPSPSKDASSPQCLSFDSAIKCHLDSIKSSESISEKAENLGDSMKLSKTLGFSDYEEVPVENSTKPLWQHLSEELILAEMDQNVVSSFRKAESRKLGFSEYTKATSKSPKSPVLDAKVLPSIHIDHKIHLPGTEDRIVVYFTSLRGIRRTYEDCCIVRTIFTGLRVPVDERDISMDSSYRKELQTALDKATISLPQVFVRGRHLGGVEEVKQLHEDGELAKVVEGFPVQDPGFVCENCGGARFVPCLNCNGSRKVFVEDEGALRRCSHCNENGLIRCSNCCS